MFGRKSDNLKEISNNNIDLNIHQHNLKELLKNAVLEKDYRLAIRYSFLDTLKELENKEIIKWDAEKTNLDYYAEIADVKQKDQFKYIAYLYNYCWYGEFEINFEEYQQARQSFKKMVEMI